MITLSITQWLLHEILQWFYVCLKPFHIDLSDPNPQFSTLRLGCAIMWFLTTVLIFATFAIKSIYLIVELLFELTAWIIMRHRRHA